MRPAADRVTQAASQLAALKLGRNGSTLIRWLLAKFAGAALGAGPVEFGTSTARTFCDAYFGVPGRELHRWYDPFSGNWQRDSGAGWPVGTVWSRIKQPTRTLTNLLSLTESATGANLVVEAASEDQYLAGLRKIVPSAQQVPALELAIWRYRFGVPDGVSTDDELVEALAAELHLAEAERAVVFVTQPARGVAALSLVEDWPDEDLADALPDPARSATAAPPPEPPRDEPAVEEEDYEALEHYAKLPLESADVDALIGRVNAEVQRAGLLLPDSELAEQCVLTLLTGHLVLQGPPGTGKTTLARALAEAFDCRSELQTATADWSTYDVIGGLQPSVGADGQEVLRPWLGHVPKAALRCARTAREHEEDPTGEPYQAHWLVIDEFSRAQVDKAIGGLYTMLGGSGEQSLELWFESDPGRKVVPIPRRFRLIGTMNDVDASFVYDFSQGLSRRFQFVYVGVPRQEDLDDEIEAALANAARWLVAEYPDQAGTGDDRVLLDRWRSDVRIGAVTGVLGQVLARLRYPAAGAAAGGWPVGTAQVGDVLRRIVLRETGTGELLPVLDAALAARVVPQMSGVRPVVLENLIDWLRGEHPTDLARTIRAAEHLRDTSTTT